MFRSLSLSCLLAAIAFGANPQRSGKYELLLRLPPEGLFASEEQQIEFRLTDTSRVDPVQGATPVIRAKVTGVIEMPAMPGMPKVKEIAHPEGVAGEYGLHPSFPHGGEYRLRLQVEPPADTVFSLEFPLTVADANENRKPGAKPFRVEMRANPKTPKAGEEFEIALRVFAVKPDAGKSPVTDFDRVHDADMHLIVVRSDLGAFQHEHPKLESDGTFRLKTSLLSGGEYRLFADVAPRGAGSQVLTAVLKVSGKGEKFSIESTPVSAMAVVQGTQIELDGDRFPSRKTITVKATLTAAGQPVHDLQPYFGAMGHLILIHQDGLTYVHSHPDERDASSLKPGVIPFLARFPKPGLYRGWAQFQRGKTVLTASVVVEAQ